MLVRGHPRSGKRGYVAEHILVVERAMGKHLVRPAEVHHFNGDKQDNRNANLVVCQDRAYHALLHQRQRALAASGHADWVQCYYCKGWGPTSEMANHRTTAHYHKPCIAAYHATLKGA